MPRRVLAIGLGGTGKAALLAFKDRLTETYGMVPDNVALLQLDTDDLREGDHFAGTRLNPAFDERGREPEFQHIVSPPGVTMDTIFAGLAQGRSTPYMFWLEREKLARVLGPSERDIRGGAQQRRPVGRAALFLRWATPITEAIRNAIARVYGDPDAERPMDAKDLERGKRLIFIVGSVAGGTGSGFLLDIVNLVRHVAATNSNWQSIDVWAIVVLPDTFRAYTPSMQDPTNLKPNSYAALRELDRFRIHSAALPFAIRYGEDIRSITWSTNQPLDHIYLVDTASRTASQDYDLSGDPIRGVFPLIADFIMAHVDTSLGNDLATLRSNVGQLYDIETGRVYSSFNVMTYIFPVNDVIESFGFRFLREMLARFFLPIEDREMRALLDQEANREMERLFAENAVGGKVNPGVVQKGIATTRKVKPELVDVSRTGLFNLVALSAGAFAEDSQHLQQALDYLVTNLIATKEGEYKHETYDDGYARLSNFGEQFMDDFLGPQTDPDDEESRKGGDWDAVLGRYRDALRQRFAEALDAALLDILNRRDPASHVLTVSRLPYARMFVAALKDRLLQFRALLEREYKEQQIGTRIRQIGEELRNAVAWMFETKDTRTFALLGKPDARKAQDSYISLLVDKMELVLHQRIYRVVMDVLDGLGAAERDSARQLSVVQMAALELENWQLTFGNVDKIAQEWSRTHESNREAKRRVKMRRYLTDPEFEKALYQRPEHVGAVAMRVLGQARGAKGLTWDRKEKAVPLDYRLITTWGEEATGAEEIARKFFVGIRELFQVVRQNVNVVERIADTFTSVSALTRKAMQVEEPFLRYNPTLNDGRTMYPERYVSFRIAGASDKTRQFLEQVVSPLADQGFNVGREAESAVAFTVVYVARGVRLGAVDQFVACEPEYRNKLYRGLESIHLFPEEQVATSYEQRIDILGEADNRLRSFVPELVVAMGDEIKLKAFTLACAYGLIDQAEYRDEDTQVQTIELFLNLGQQGGRFRLTSRKRLRERDPRFLDVSGSEQINRLYLNALQNFVLKITEMRGVPLASIAQLSAEVANRGISLEHIDSPFALSPRSVYAAILAKAEELGPSTTESPDQAPREALNAQRRIEKYLQPFLDTQVRALKSSPKSSIRDLGTVMHLIIREEINALKELIARSVSPDEFWAEWRQVVLNQVLTNGQVEAQELGRIPEKFRAYAIERFVRENSEMRLLYTQDKQQLSLVSAQSVVTFVERWRRFGEQVRVLSGDRSGEEPSQERAESVAADATTGLIESLASLLDTSSYGEVRVEGRFALGLELQSESLLDGITSSKQLPCVLPLSLDLTELDAANLWNSLKGDEPRPRVVLMFVFGDSSWVEKTRRVVRTQMDVHACDVIAIGWDEIVPIILAKDIVRALHRFILRHVKLIYVSPFVSAGQTPDTVFFGREREIRKITENLGQVSFAVIGGRRMGKSSLLGRLHRRDLPTAGFCTYYLDCATKDYDRFLQDRPRDRDWKPERPASAPSNFDRLFRSGAPGKPLAILLDEADALISPDQANGWKLFSILRGAASSGLFQVVLSGSRYIQDAIRDSTGSLFNSVNKMLLGPLDYDAVKELITQPLRRIEIEVVDQEEVVKRIYQFTSGHPSIVQRLCHRLVTRLSDLDKHSVTIGDVEEIIADTEFVQEDFLTTYFSQSSVLEHLCALLMSIHPQPRSLEAVQECLAQHGVVATLNQVNAALERLVDLRCILHRTPGGYDFSVTALPLVVSMTSRATDWIALRKEIFLHAGDVDPDRIPPDQRGKLW